MKKELWLATISSYGTVSNPEKRYISSILFSDKDKFLAALSDFLRMQIMIGSLVPEYKEELEDVDTMTAFSQIRKEIAEISTELEGMLSGEGELDNRTVISIPEILTDFHIELLKPAEDDLRWIGSCNNIGILVSPCFGGCCNGIGEFLTVDKLYDTNVNVDSGLGETQGYCIQSEEENPCYLEEYRMVIPLIKV